MPWRILNAEPRGYSPHALSILSRHAILTSKPYTRSELLRVIADYDGLIVRLGYMLDQELFQAAKGRLRFVATPTTGLTHVDQHAAQASNVVILSLRGETEFLKGVTATAEFTLALMLALCRRIPAASSHVLSGGWLRDDYRGLDLSGKILGVIGYGRIGRMVASLAQAFGMRVIAHDPAMVGGSDGAVSFLPLTALLDRADIVSLHASYKVGQDPILSRREFQQLRSAYFVNTARGELVDEEALLEALQRGNVAGAALDVIANEHDTKSATRQGLLRFSQASPARLIITPHIGGATAESMEKTEVFIAEKIVGFITSSNHDPR